MSKALRFIKEKLNLPYPFDFEVRYYQYVPFLAWVVSIFQVLLEIKFSKSIEFDPIFGFDSGYLYFLIFAVLFYVIMEIVKNYTLNSAFKFMKSKKWRVVNQLCISFRLGIVCYLYIVFSIFVFDIKISYEQPSLLILFFKSLFFIISLTIMAFIYDFNHDKKVKLKIKLEELEKSIEQQNLSQNREGNFSKTNNLLDIHPMLKTDAQSIVCCYSESNYVIFKLNKIKETIRIKITFKEIEEKLKEYPYLIKCNRGLIINFNYLESINKVDKNKLIYVKNIDKPFPISRNYLAQVESYLSNK